MRSATSIRSTTSSNSRIAWPAPLLLGLLITLALWLVGSSPSLQAQRPTLPGNAQSLPQDLVPLDGIAQVAAGGSHTCVLTVAGGVKCWGNNDSGQLGDGTTADKSTPVDVVGLGSGVAAIAVGSDHTCALTAAGGVKCWGRNDFGQGGSGSLGGSNPIPEDVVGLGSGVAAITAGWGHTCALTTAGGVKCWGYNAHGQLGDDTTTDKSTLVDVNGLSSGVVAIAAGGWHTCALTTRGGVKCWGYNAYGQLGDGTTTNTPTPIDVSGLSSSVAAITAGGLHTCVLTTVGGVKCWGYNNAGQLGDGTTTDRSTPVDVIGLDGSVTSVVAGSSHTCALTAANGVKCWGGNYYGQIGDGTGTNKTTPMDVVGLDSGIAAVAVGGNHTCALTAAGGVKCWGFGYFGQLGDNTGGNKSSPVDVVGLGSGVAAVVADGGQTCALTTNGGVKCWGYNRDGELGDGTTASKGIPADVTGLGSGVTAIATGQQHTCALTTAGGVKCWGYNRDGQLGDGTSGYDASKSNPVDVVGLNSGVAAIAAGAYHTCALSTTGGVKCWGRNEFGQLGDGTTWNAKNTPVDVVGLSSGVAAIAAGGGHTCALTTAGGIKCWGYNSTGQLGDGTTADKSTPVAVVGLNSGVAAIAAGGGHTCALTTGGGVKCWGYNKSGQLGDGTTQIVKSTPVDTEGLGSGVTAIDAGDEHTCAVSTTGGIKCWGYNEYGQLGDGSTVNKSTPMNVAGLDSGVTAIATGQRHTCVLNTTGGVKCWGSNISGQLGDATVARTTPVDVLVEVTLSNQLFLPAVQR